MTGKVLTRRRLISGLAAASVLGTAPARAQCAPVNLPIQNIPQQTQVWCWVAVAQQIIQWRTGATPPQCALVAMANELHPETCCNGHPACLTTGTLNQIQFLIGYYGWTYSAVAPPTGPQVLYNTLATGRPIIMAVQQSPYAGHVVVLRGMSCVGPNAVLHINDPIGWPFMAQPVAYSNILPIWSHAIVVG